MTIPQYGQFAQLLPIAHAYKVLCNTKYITITTDIYIYILNILFATIPSYCSCKATFANYSALPCMMNGVVQKLGIYTPK